MNMNMNKGKAVADSTEKKDSGLELLRKLTSNPNQIIYGLENVRSLVVSGTAVVVFYYDAREPYFGKFVSEDEMEQDQSDLELLYESEDIHSVRDGRHVLNVYNKKYISVNYESLDCYCVRNKVKCFPMPSDVLSQFSDYYYVTGVDYARSSQSKSLMKQLSLAMAGISYNVLSQSLDFNKKYEQLIDHMLDGGSDARLDLLKSQLFDDERENLLSLCAMYDCFRDPKMNMLYGQIRSGLADGSIFSNYNGVMGGTPKVFLRSQLRGSGSRRSGRRLSSFDNKFSNLGRDSSQDDANNTNKENQLFNNESRFPKNRQFNCKRKNMSESEDDEALKRMLNSTQIGNQRNIGNNSHNSTTDNSNNNRDNGDSDVNRRMDMDKNNTTNKFEKNNYKNKNNGNQNSNDTSNMNDMMRSPADAPVRQQKLQKLVNSDKLTPQQIQELKQREAAMLATALQLSFDQPNKQQIEGKPEQAQ